MNTQRVLTILLTLGILFSSLGFSPAAPGAVSPIPEAVCVRQIQVKGPPDLRKIAEEIGMNWRKLAQLNGIPESMPWLVSSHSFWLACRRSISSLTATLSLMSTYSVGTTTVIVASFQYPQSDRLRFNSSCQDKNRNDSTFQYPQSDRLRFNVCYLALAHLPDNFQYPQSDRLRFNFFVQRLAQSGAELSVSAIGSTSLQRR